jgi:hypothetical protein
MSATSKTGVGKLWLLNFFGNAALLTAVYGWLLIPDAHGWQVAGSVLLAVGIIFCGVWLRAGTLAYFRVTDFREGGAVWRAFRHALRHLVAFLLWASVLAALVLVLLALRHYTPQFGVWLWQKLPGGLRFGAPRQMTSAADWLLGALMGVIVPAIWLPVATTVAAAGFDRRRMAHSWRALKPPMYWILFCALMFVGAYIPYNLVWWIPELGDLRQQAWSMGLRFFAAYVIVITAWIALVWMAGTRTERQDQSGAISPIG